MPADDRGDEAGFGSARIGVAHRSSAWRRVGPFACLALLALVPVLITPIPAMVDYPNHLARMYILFGDEAGFPHPFYETAWAFTPNLAMDLLVPRWARILGVEGATKAFLLVSQLLTITGAIAIELAVRRRFRLGGILALATLYSVPFAWGFLNFQFGLGLALWGLAAWLVLPDRHGAWRLAIHALFVVLLFAAHLFALGLYGFVLGVHELWRARSRRTPPREVLVRFGILAMPALCLLGLMAAAGGSVGAQGTFWRFELKLLWLFGSLNGYDLPLSIACSVVLALLVRELARRGALRFVASGAWLATALAALYVVVPSTLFDTAFVDLRVVVAAMLILPAFVEVSPPSRAWARAGLAIVVGIAAVTAGRAGMVALVYRQEYAALIASFEELPKGARVLVAHRGAGEDPPLSNLGEFPLYNAPTLATHYARAFVPTLFTSRGKQPIAAREPFRRLALPYGGPVPVARLKGIADGPASSDVPAFIRTWTADYDHVYVLGPPTPNPMPDRLDPRASGTLFTLYRVRRPDEGAPVR